MPVRSDRAARRALLGSTAARAARRPDDPAAARAALNARRDYYAAALEDHIRAVVQTAPPLTAEQVERLRGLLPAPSTVDAPDLPEAC